MTGIANARRLACITLLFVCMLASATVFAQEPDEVIAAVIDAAEAKVIQRVDSPDGSFYTEVTVYPCVDIGEQVASYERLDLTDNRTGETQKIAEQVINCGGLGAFGLFVYRWSADAAYLYYTDSREGTPDGLVTIWVPQLWRVKLADLQIEPLGQALFSPDGQKLISWNRSEIKVIPVDSDDSTAFTLLPDGLVMVNVIWLPDNSGLLYIQADQPIMSTRSTVTHVDLTTLEQTVLMDNGE